MPSNPRWPAAAVDDSANQNVFLIVRVVDGERETVGQHTVEIAISFRVDAEEDLQRFDIGVKTRQKVAAQPRLLLFVELKSLDQVVARRIKDLHSHRVA